MEVYGSVGDQAWKHGQILTFAVEDDAVGWCLSPRGWAIDDTGGLRLTDTDFDPKTWSHVTYAYICQLVGGLEHDFYFPIQLGMESSSQLTKSYMFQRGSSYTTNQFTIIY